MCGHRHCNTQQILWIQQFWWSLWQEGEKCRQYNCVAYGALSVMICQPFIDIYGSVALDTARLMRMCILISILSMTSCLLKRSSALHVLRKLQHSTIASKWLVTSIIFRWCPPCHDVRLYFLLWNHFFYYNAWWITAIGISSVIPFSRFHPFIWRELINDSSIHVYFCACGTSVDISPWWLILAIELPSFVVTNPTFLVHINEWWRPGLLQE